jgi:error-prone DNA polymerase
MGFYQPAQLVIDARNHGVDVRPIDVNYSMWNNKLEEKSGKYYALRLGFRQIKGMREEDIQALIVARSKKFTTVTELRNAGIGLAALEKMAEADAFRSLGLDRRRALWEVSALADLPIALFAGQPSESVMEQQVSLPLMRDSEHVVQDYAATSLSLKAHPVSFIREKLRLLHVRSSADLKQMKDGEHLKIAGLVLVRQRPGTAGGVCFMTIEDEFGFSNLVIFQNLFDQYRKEILQARLLMVEGKLQREDEVVHVIVRRCFDLSVLLRGLTEVPNEDPPVLTLSPRDEKSTPFPTKNKRTQVRQHAQEELFPPARNFK